MRPETSRQIEAWCQSIVDLKRVQEKLDDTGAPAHIAAHIDLGICSLKEAVSEVLNACRTDSDTE